MNKKKKIRVLNWKCIVLCLTMSTIQGLMIFSLISKNSSLEDKGISVIGAAVSVWIGLNIYNVIEKREFEALKEKIDKESSLFEELNKQKNEMIKEIANNKIQIVEKLNKIDSAIDGSSEFSKAVFVNILLSTSVDEMSGYFAILFDENVDADKTDQSTYKQLCRIENLFALTYNAYENGFYDDAIKYSEQGFKKIKDYGNEESTTDNSCISAYINFRKGEFLYYKCISINQKRKSTSEIYNDLKKAIRYYDKSYELLSFNDDNADEFNKDKIISYFKNTCGYAKKMIYDELEKIYFQTKDEKYKTEMDKYLSDARCDLEMACSFKDIKARYYRNLGTVYEKLASLRNCKEFVEKAKDYYLKCIEEDYWDQKAHYTYASIILKNIDEKLGLTADRENIIAEMRFTTADIDINNDIDKVIDDLEAFVKISPRFPGLYFLLGKSYTHKYILSTTEGKGVLYNTALEWLNLSIKLGTENGALYNLRNLYEAAGKIDMAMEINNKLLGDGDSKKIAILYEKYKDKYK